MTCTASLRQASTPTGFRLSSPKKVAALLPGHPGKRAAVGADKQWGIPASAAQCRVYLGVELRMLCSQDPRSGEVVEKDLYVTRKGATPAADGQMGLIPGSMGRPTAVVQHA